MSTHTRILLYADVNLGLIDGSSIWVQSLVSTLLQGSSNHITVVTRMRDARGIVTGPLQCNERVAFVGTDLADEELSPHEASDLISSLDDQKQFDVVIIRGNDVALHCASSGQFEGRIWLYYLPPKDGAPSSAEGEFLKQVAPHCRHILCQTEAVRSYVEAISPALANRLLVLPPMIPRVECAPNTAEDADVQVLYSGKLAPEYRFLDMVETVRELRRRGVNASFIVAGDKIHNPKD